MGLLPMHKLEQASERVRMWLTRKRDYQACFCEPGGDATKAGSNVLRDIAQFCGAYTTTAKISPVNRTVDPVAMGIAEGRRQVYLHIQRRLRLSDEKILSMMEEAHD